MKKEFLREPFVTVVAEFLNEYQERYVIYKFDHIDGKLFVTGSEMDWESGYEVEVPKIGEVRCFRPYRFSHDEQYLIRKLIPARGKR